MGAWGQTPEVSCSGGYKNLVISLQILMVAAILSLIPLLPEVLQLGGRAGAEKLRWSLFWVAITNAISDLCLDAFALRWLRGGKHWTQLNHPRFNGIEGDKDQINID